MDLAQYVSCIGFDWLASGRSGEDIASLQPRVMNSGHHEAVDVLRSLEKMSRDLKAIGLGGLDVLLRHCWHEAQERWYSENEPFSVRSATLRIGDGEEMPIRSFTLNLAESAESEFLEVARQIGADMVREREERIMRAISRGDGT